MKHGAAKSCQKCSKAPGHNEVVCRGRELLVPALNSVCRPPQCSQATLSGAAVAIILGLAGEFARFLYFNIIMFVKNIKGYVIILNYLIFMNKLFIKNNLCN